MLEFIVKVPDWLDSDKLSDAIREYMFKHEEFDNDNDRFYVNENDMIY